MEEWKIISEGGFRTKYEVSSMGRIRSVGRVSILDGRLIPGKIIRQHHRRKDSTQYLTVSVGSKTYAAHRLIAAAFIPNPENKPEINHKNGIKHDNRVENLEWCTRLENVRHAKATGLWDLKIKDSDVLFIRENFKSLGKHKLAAMFNVDPTYIYAVATHKEKKFVETPVFQTNSPMASTYINQYDKNGNFIMEHKSISSASKHIGSRLSAIQRVLSGERSSVNGFRFSYTGEALKEKVPSKRIIPKKHPKINQFSIDGAYIATFRNKSVAAKSAGIHKTTLRKHLQGFAKTAGGFVWKIID